MDDLIDTSPPKKGEDPVDIDPNGDLLLRIRDHGTSTDHEYRVSTRVLQLASHYFNVLLDPSKFSEGIAVDRKIKTIHRMDGAIPHLELPKIILPDIGQVPHDVSTKPAVELFLRILHNEDTSWPTPRASFAVLLAIVADRFTATAPVSNFIIHRKWKGKLVPQKGSGSASEAQVRQLLLIGLILRFPDWVRQYSATMVVQGSTKWSAPDEEVREAEAMWWNLPNGLEGEYKAAGKYKP